MSGDPVPGASSSEPASSHLDDDPEALEDPVHRGDARHQHEAHLREAAARAAGEGGRDDDPSERQGATGGTAAAGD
jgi:hypothetical protein